MILATKRHVLSPADFNDSEALEFAMLVRKIRRAQREVLGIEHVYFFYNEDTSHHFHLWMLPRLDWMNELGRGPESMRAALLHLASREAGEEEIKATRLAASRLRAVWQHP